MKKTTKLIALLATLLTTYTGIALYLGVVLRHNFLQSDTLGYWKDSLQWQTPFHRFHVPGYPLMIATLRLLTGGLIGPVSLMMFINLVALVVSACFVYRLLQISGTNESCSIIGTLLFCLWPFVGITYAVQPLADLPAMGLFLAGLYYLQRSRLIFSSVYLGLALVTHKAMWLIVGLLIMADLFQNKWNNFTKKKLLFFLILVLPIGILWLSGSYYHKSVVWLISNNIQVEVTSRGNLPLLDGILGSSIDGGMLGIVKSILLTAFTLVATLCLFLSIKIKYHYYQFGAALSISILILFITLNQYEIWAAVRFSRILALPLLAGMYTSNYRCREMTRPLRLTLAIFFLILLGTQFAYSWYMARIYFG